MAKILIVEDEEAMAALVASCLAAEGHVVDTVCRGDDGLQMIDCYAYDLAILDWQLPEISGIEICKRHRSRGGKTAILMLTGRSHVGDRVFGLDSGADDYLTKPFNADELKAHVRALLRRQGERLTSTVLSSGSLRLDTVSREVTFMDISVQLIPKEFAILELLLRQPNKAFRIEEIVNSVWKAEEVGSAEAVRTHMKNLRKKLSTINEEPVIETVHAIGYKLLAKN